MLGRWFQQRRVDRIEREGERYGITNPPRVRRWKLPSLPVIDEDRDVAGSCLGRNSSPIKTQTWCVQHLVRQCLIPLTSSGLRSHSPRGVIWESQTGTGRPARPGLRLPNGIAHSPRQHGRVCSVSGDRQSRWGSPLELRPFSENHIDTVCRPATPHHCPIS